VYIPTVTVNRESQLVEGVWYLITGPLQDQKSGLPQLFFLRKKLLHTEALGIPYMVGDLYYWHNGKKRAHIRHSIPLADVNIPAHGYTDIHLERIEASKLSRRLREEYDRLHEAQHARRGNGGTPFWAPVHDKIYGPYHG
jgi:hypothetical protein